MAQYYHPSSAPTEQKKIIMIETPRYTESNDYLLSLFYTNANKNSPEFISKYKSTEQSIEINFTILLLRLHQEGLTEILQFANVFQTKVDAILHRQGIDRMASAGAPLETIEEGDENAEGGDHAEEQKIVKRATAKGSSIVDSIKVKVVAQMEQVAIEMENEKRPITNMKIQNLDVGIVMKTSYTELTAKLQDIIVDDLNSESIHSRVIRQMVTTHFVHSFNRIYCLQFSIFFFWINKIDFVCCWWECVGLSNCPLQFGRNFCVQQRRYENRRFHGLCENCLFELVRDIGAGKLANSRNALDNLIFLLFLTSMLYHRHRVSSITSKLLNKRLPMLVQRLLKQPNKIWSKHIRMLSEWH